MDDIEEKECISPSIVALTYLFKLQTHPYLLSFQGKNNFLFLVPLPNITAYSTGKPEWELICIFYKWLRSILDTI